MTPADFDGFNTFPMLVENFNANQVRPSAHVGLHPQLVHFDVRRSSGVNAGFNQPTTVAPGYSRTYEWYAGRIDVLDDGTVVATPVEFGATNLIPADPLKHSNKGLIGALIIEPEGATWSFPEAGTRAAADVTFGGSSFREFVVLMQDDLNLLMPGDPDPVPIPPVGNLLEDAEDTGQKAINYRTEPMWTRLGFNPAASLAMTNLLDFTGALSIAATGAIETPIFNAQAGTRVRFRVLHPQGHGRNQVFSLHGHMWRHEPSNPYSDYIGSQAGHGPGGHWDVIPLHGAGGGFGVPGDYLYRNRSSLAFDGGAWGIFRVTE
jgi:hypothetical protein